MPREPTIKQRLAHLHELAHENSRVQEFQTKLLRRILRKEETIMSAIDELNREVEETKTAVLAALAEMQRRIDEILANPGNEAAVAAAAAKLDELQTQITGILTPPTP